MTSRFDKVHKDEHHNIPISCGGMNWKENCMILNRTQHSQLHEILDIPYGILRRFRKRTNHLLYSDEYYVDELRKLHLLYFARFTHLHYELQNKHADCMQAVMLRASREYSVEIVMEPTDKTVHGRFQHYLNQYHNILYARALYMEQRLPPQIHPT